MDDKTIIHFEGKDMPASEWLDLVTKRQERRKPNGETMAEQWQRQKPATYTRNYYDDGKDDQACPISYCNLDSSIPITVSNWSMVVEAS